jgi:cytochrome c peroxidase
MGFDDQEIVALSGAHAIGRCHATASGYVGPWTFTPQIFNNQYFVLLKNLKWDPDSKQSKFQFTDPSGKLMMLPSDIVLIQDSGFRAYVEKYASNNKVFFSDFAAAFQKLEELGTKDLVEV